MRKVSYRAVRIDGTEFHTTSYREATEGGNRIIQTYLTKIDERTQEQKTQQKAQAQKIHELYTAKRG